MEFKLQNPPVAEVWIQASFAPAADGVEWDWRDAIEFLDSFEDLPIRESLPQFVPVVTSVAPGDLPDEIQIQVTPRFARARTDTRSQIVQIGENELLVSHVRESDDNYPGFTPLKGLFLEALRGYRDTFTPAKVLALELHYVDIVVLPATPGQVFNLSDLFAGAPDLPEQPFGNAVDAAWSFGFLDSDTGDLGQFAVRILAPEPGFVRFRLDWHRRCQGFDETESGIADRLSEAHNYLKQCFRSVCKDPVWTVFEPE